MTMTGDNRGIRRKPSPSATLLATSPIRTGLASNQGLRVKKPATNGPSHGKSSVDRITDSSHSGLSKFCSMPPSEHQDTTMKSATTTSITPDRCLYTTPVFETVY
jgi:hypothetical protein